jgi:hypothetical protein
MSWNSNLLSYWKLDSQTKSSVGGYTGTSTNISFGAGKIKDCAIFSTGNINYGSVLVQTTNLFSISFWIKTTTSGTRRGIIANAKNDGTGYYIDLLPGGTIRSSIATNGGNYRVRDSSVSINDGNWHLVIFVRSTVGNLPDIYIDNTLRNGGFFSAGTVNDIFYAGNFHLGKSDTSTADFIGSLDEIAFSKTAFDASERAALWNSGNGISYINSNFFPFFQ